MNKEQAVTYLRFSGFSDEQIKAIEGASSGWGKVCPSAGIDCEDCPAYEPKTGHWIDDGQYAEGHSEHACRCSKCGYTYIGYTDKYKECPNCGAKMTESEEKPKSECEHDHEILKAYSDGANAVLDNVRAEIDGLLNDEDSNMYAHGVMDCLEIIDKYKAESEG